MTPIFDIFCYEYSKIWQKAQIILPKSKFPPPKSNYLPNFVKSIPLLIPSNYEIRKRKPHLSPTSPYVTQNGLPPAPFYRAQSNDHSPPAYLQNGKSGSPKQDRCLTTSTATPTNLAGNLPRKQTYHNSNPTSPQTLLRSPHRQRKSVYDISLSNITNQDDPPPGKRYQPNIASPTNNTRCFGCVFVVCAHMGRRKLLGHRRRQGRF